MLRPMFLAALAVGLAATGPALAQTGAPPASPPKPAPSASPSLAQSALPDRTTASFGDWTLRCERRRDGGTPAKLCELTQAIQRAGDAGPLAQLALGRLASNEPLKLTVVLPLNVALATAPKVTVDAKDGPAVQTAWQRCLPAGCLASAPLPDDTVKKLRSAGETGKLEYRDAADREVSLPYSLRGLPEALDALARESAN
ncbi:MAG: invasion associated locus B family protein [Proteobacteria bacterium]|nr:invasion associated locus B family protein [Pseudomonadota bacterium]